MLLVVGVAAAAVVVVVDEVIKSTFIQGVVVHWHGLAEFYVIAE